LLDLLKVRFKTVRHYKPPASRQESAETFLVATGFKG
ncbi:MAG: SAM-dependent methyltransferase, partial [Oceanicaulis sp.]